MRPGQLLSTYTFWEITARWSADIGEAEDVTARALVSGIVRDGLRFQSVEPRRIAGGEALRGQPYVGYCAQPWLKIGPHLVRPRGTAGLKVRRADLFLVPIDSLVNLQPGVLTGSS